MSNATNDFTAIELETLGSVTGGAGAASDLGAMIKGATDKAIGSITGEREAREAARQVVTSRHPTSRT